MQQENSIELPEKSDAIVRKNIYSHHDYIILIKDFESMVNNHHLKQFTMAVGSE